MNNGNVSNTCSPVAPTQLGSRLADNRLFVEAVLYRFRAGIPWRDLPERFGDFRVIHTRFSRWSKTGVWERVFQALGCEADNEYAAIDATIVRAHQHSAGAKASCAEDEDIGRSRGGLSTKIHAVVDALGNPIFFLTDGQTSFDLWEPRSYTTSPKICYNRTQARKDDYMKVNYPERIEDTVTELKIIMSQQRTVMRQTKSSGTLFVKIWFEPEHYRCS